MKSDQENTSTLSLSRALGSTTILIVHASDAALPDYLSDALPLSEISCTSMSERHGSTQVRMLRHMRFSVSCIQAEVPEVSDR